MNFDVIKVGDLVELHIGAISTRSKVERVDNEDAFVIAQPTHKLFPLTFEKGEEVSFFFFRENGIYSFLAEYTGRGTINQIRVCGFKKKSDVQKNQRRLSYRLPVTLSVLVRHKNQYDPISSKTLSASTINISQEGLLFSSNINFAVDTRLLMEIHLSKTELLIIPGIVVRYELPLGPDEPYMIGVKFVNLSKRDAAQITRFILNRQIKLRKLRLPYDGEE